MQDTLLKMTEGAFSVDQLAMLANAVPDPIERADLAAYLKVRCHLSQILEVEAKAYRQLD